MKMKKITGYFLKHPYLCVFLSAFFISGAMLFTAGGIIGSDDPLYHIAHARAYWTGQPMNLPIVSTMSDFGGGDLYFLYHITMSPFTSFFNGENYDALTIGVSIFHSMLIASFFLVFFVVTKNILRLTNEYFDEKTIVIYAYVASAFLFIVSATFTFRLFLIRPHIISIMIILLAVYFLLRKNNFGIFAISFILVFFYSVSFMIFLPIGIYILSDLIYNKKSVFNIQLYKPAFSAAFSIAFGMIFLPNPIHYLYNAYYIHLTMLVNRFADIPEGGELYPPNPTFREIIWLFPFIMLLVHYLARILEKKEIRKIFNYEKFYLTLMSLLLFILYIFIARAAEYFFPILTILFSVIFFNEILPYLKKMAAEKKFFLSVPKESVAEKINIAFQDIFENKKAKKYFRLTIISFITIYSTGMVLSITTASLLSADHSEYKNSAKFIEQNSSDSDIVLTRYFSEYPPMVFFNQKNRYLSGMGNTFSYIKDKKKFRLMQHISSTDEKGICAEKECDNSNKIDIYQAVQNELNVKFIIVNNSDKIPDHQKFLESIQKEKRFKNIFTDPQYPWMMVYRVE